MRKSFWALATFLPAVLAVDIYVSPDGSDDAAGTLDAPLLSIQLAVDQATPGSTIYLRGGTYSPTTNIQITKSGTASAPYILRAYDGEAVIIDGEALPGYVLACSEVKGTQLTGPAHRQIWMHLLPTRTGASYTFRTRTTGNFMTWS
jgi:hypothetical protein